MTIAIWPAANTPSGNKIADVREYYNTATTTLCNGAIVRPTLRTAKQLVDCAYLLAPMAMAVEPDSYRA